MRTPSSEGASAKGSAGSAAGRRAEGVSADCTPGARPATPVVPLLSLAAAAGTVKTPLQPSSRMATGGGSGWVSHRYRGMGKGEDSNSENSAGKSSTAHSGSPTQAKQQPHSPGDEVSSRRDALCGSPVGRPIPQLAGRDMTPSSTPLMPRSKGSKGAEAGATPPARLQAQAEHQEDTV